MLRTWVSMNNRRSKTWLLMLNVFDMKHPLVHCNKSLVDKRQGGWKPPRTLAQSLIELMLHCISIAVRNMS